MSETAVRSHVRENRSLLAACERRTLLWLAKRLPEWVTSDQLTAIALTAMLGSGLAFWMASRNPAGLVIVVAGLVVNWFGDSLDRNPRPGEESAAAPLLGFYVDHVVDLIGTCALLGGLGASGYMSPLVALGAAGRLPAGLGRDLSRHPTACGVFRMSTWKFGPTELAHRPLPSEPWP